MLMIGVTISSAPIELNYINYVKIENGIYDDVYSTHVNDSVKSSFDFNVPDEWDTETYFHAKFNGDLSSGNTDFGIKNTSNIIVKRREVGKYQWMPLFNIEVDSVSDFDFTLTDPYARSYTSYEYAVVPIINNEEWTYSISDPVYVSFDCLVIIDKDDRYSTLFDISINQQKNNVSTNVVPIGAKYPIYVSNAMNDYYTGNISATFLNYDCSSHDIDENEVIRFRYEVLDFLNNKKPKYIKDPFGRCWIATIGTAITDDENGGIATHKISFDFTEVGNISSNEDMNKFGLLELEKEWWI